MPTRPARPLACSGVTALALGLLALTPGAALADPGQDPPGNNGTIKIDPYGGAAGNANHPHPGCDFRLQLFGFDRGQTGTITFTGQAPTSGAVTAQPLTGSHLLSDDRAGGGQDVDAHFDVRGADLGLSGTPAKQGFHVKVRVDADGAPGGAKTKVFWLSCPAASTPAGAAAPATPTTSTAGTTQGTTSGAVTAAAESTTTTRSSALRSTTTPQAAQDAGRQAAADTAPVTTPEDRPAARSTGRTGAPAGLALPFTGAPAAALAGLGLTALAAGTVAVAAGRRRRTPGLDG